MGDWWLGWPTNNNYWSSTVYSAGNHYNVNLNNGNGNNRRCFPNQPSSSNYPSPW